MAHRDPPWRLDRDRPRRPRGRLAYLPTHDSLRPATSLNPGDYVKVVGSLVTDEPHLHGGIAPRGAKEDWSEGFSAFDEANPARWTEVHPPDIITKLADPGRTELLYAMAVVAKPADLEFGGIERSCTATLPAPQRRAPHTRVAVREIVGAETTLKSIEEGNADLAGAQITIGATSATVHVKIRGDYNGTSGHFKAVYRVTWEPYAGPYPMTVSLSPNAPEIPYNIPVECTVTAADTDTSTALTGTVSVDGKQVGITGTAFTTTFKPTIKPAPHGRITLRPKMTITVSGYVPVTLPIGTLEGGQ